MNCKGRPPALTPKLIAKICNCQLSSWRLIVPFQKIKEISTQGFPDAPSDNGASFADLPKLPFRKKKTECFCVYEFRAMFLPLCFFSGNHFKAPAFASALSSNKNNKPVVAHANRIGTELQANIYTTAGHCGSSPLLESQRVRLIIRATCLCGLKWRWFLWPPDLNEIGQLWST